MKEEFVAITYLVPKKLAVHHDCNVRQQTATDHCSHDALSDEEHRVA